MKRLIVSVIKVSNKVRLQQPKTKDVCVVFLHDQHCENNRPQNNKLFYKFKFVLDIGYYSFYPHWAFL